MIEDFVPIELAIRLKDIDFKSKTLFCYNDVQVINPEVIEKYGNLTDDGYYELTEDGGGELKWDYVYIYQTKIMLNSEVICEKNRVPAPTIGEVVNWLLKDKNIFICTHPRPMGITFIIYKNVFFDNYVLNYDFEYEGENSYFTPQDALIEGIQYICENLL